MARRHAAIALAAVVLVTGGCQADERTSLRFGLASSPVTLDPRFATDAASTRINRLLYRRLVEFDARSQPAPALASWEQITPTHYRFSLNRERAPFSNGVAVTARDVEATYRSILDPDTGSPHRGSLEAIERVSALGDDTVDFHLAQPDLMFPGRLVVGILPAALLQGGHEFHRQPVGSGAFEFDAWPDENRLRIRRRADGQMVEFVRVPEATVRVLKLVRGEIDMLQGDLPPELRNWLARRSDMQMQFSPGTNFAYIGFNLEDPVVGDVRVRRAIGHAIDRDVVIEHLLGGTARPASSILVPDHWAGNPDLDPIEFDLERARELLVEAGYSPTQGPKIVYKTSSNPFRVRLATLLQAQLARASIDVELKTYDWGTFYGDVKSGVFQMYSLQWVGVKMPDIFHYTMHSESVPPAGANRGRLRSERVDALIDRAEAASSRDEQARLYRELQARLLDELPYIPLWYEDQVFAARDYVGGYTLSSDGDYDGLITVRRSR